MRLTRLIPTLLIIALFFSLSGCDIAPLLPSSDENTPSTSNPPNDEEAFTPTVYTTVVRDAFGTTYADQLSPNEKAIYDAITRISIGTTDVEITLPELPRLCRGRAPTDEEMNKLSNDITAFTANALYAAWLDSPDLFWLDHTKYSYDISVENDEQGIVYLSRLTIHLSLTSSKEAVIEQSAAIAAAIEDFSVEGMTPVEKITYINEYLVSGIEYDLDAPNRGSIVGALVDGRCVCEGYARAFDYLASIAGIDAVCIPGKAFTDEHPEGEGHMWNAVRLEGALYAVDVTWNDSTESVSYLLVGAKTVCDGDAFKETHVPDMLTPDGPYKVFALPEIAELSHE